jgi:hypothetical protein
MMSVFLPLSCAKGNFSPVIVRAERSKKETGGLGADVGLTTHFCLPKNIFIRSQTIGFYTIKYLNDLAGKKFPFSQKKLTLRKFKSAYVENLCPYPEFFPLHQPQAVESAGGENGQKAGVHHQTIADFCSGYQGVQ